MSHHRALGMDYFLYSCFEFEKMRRQSNPPAEGEQATEVAPVSQSFEGRWPPIAGATLKSLPPDIEQTSLETLITRMLVWYGSQYPALCDEDALDSEKFYDVVEPFLNMTLDLSDIIFLKTGSSLPPSDSQDEKAKQIWEQIRSGISDTFMGYHAYFVKFLDWTFAEAPQDPVEIGSRPPVGRFAPHFRPQRSPSGGGGQFQGHRQGGGQDRGQHRQHGQHGGQDRGPRVLKNGGQKPAPQKPMDEEQEKVALKAVDEAIERLKSENETEEVFLTPMNSFYRRLQHQYAVSLGFESASVGDGQTRGVKISRPRA